MYFCYCFICIVYIALELINQSSSGKWSVTATDFKVRNMPLLPYVYLNHKRN